MNKYQLGPQTTNHIVMPMGTKILTVQSQGDSPCLWTLVNTDNKRETRNFRIYATGQDIDWPLEHLQYIGTFQLYGGSLVWHVFEEIDSASRVDKEG